MPKIIIFTDFDGTLSGREGGKTVFEPFYQSLLNGYAPGKILNYRQAPLKDKDTVQSLFEEKFGPYNEKFNYEQDGADHLLSPEAVKFLHTMLSNDDVSVQIITKNRQDYIRALLTYQGFSEEELTKLGIFDSVRKDMAVKGFLSMQTDTISSIYILDDNLEDFNYMVNAAISFGLAESQIQKYYKMPGTFEWATYQQDIHHLLQQSQADNNKESEVIELAIDLLSCEVATEEKAAITSKNKKEMPKPSFFSSAHVPQGTEQETPEKGNTPV